MSTRAETIVDTVIAALQTMTVAHGYTYDLSGSEGVREGRAPAECGIAPCAWVAIGTLDLDTDGLLTVDEVTLVLEIEARVTTATGTPGSKGRAAIRMFSDIKQVITTAFIPGGTLAELPYVRGIKFRGGAFDGDEYDIAPGFGVAFCQIVITYPSSFNAGV